MKILLLGGSGQLGSEIRARWAGDDILAPSHSALPLDDIGRLEAQIEKIRVDAVVNCAAFHNVDVCEAKSREAFIINALAVDAMAAACDARAITFLTISTDYVFDGEAERPYSEEDCPRPISAYGASKLAGEHLVLRRPGAKVFVLRTCGVYGRYASNSKGTFIDRVITQARNGEAVRVVSDVTASPTYAGDLAHALRALIETDSYGLYHACNTGAVTWFDYARKALELAGVPHPIEPISRSEWKAAARRPKFSALTNGRLDALGITMPTWEEGIAAYLRDKAS